MPIEKSPYIEFIINAYEVMGLSALTKFPLPANLDEPPKKETLNKAALVLLVACWETYIEDTAKKGLQFIIENANSAADLPKILRKSISRELKDDANELKIWDLAGDGWKMVAAAHANKMLHKHVGPFNTPKAGNIDNLFKDVLGIENISACWTHPCTTSAEAIKELQSIIEIRGSIAHTSKPSKVLSHAHLNSYIWILTYLSIKTNERVKEHILKTVNKYPWSETSHNKVEEISLGYQEGLKVLYSL